MPGLFRGSVYLLLGVWSCAVKVGLSAPSAICPNDTETLRNVALGRFNGSEQVLVGSSEALYRITSSFQKRQGDVVFLDTPNRLLVVDQQGTYEESVFHCEALECSLRSLSDLSEVRWAVPSSSITAGDGNVIALFAPGPNSVSLLLLGESESEQHAQLPVRTSRVAKGDLENVDEGGGYSFNALVLQQEVNALQVRDFLTTFSFQDFSYLVASLTYPNDSSIGLPQARITRVCKSDAENERLVTSYFELILECPNPCSSLDFQARAATFVSSDQPFGIEVALVSFGGNCDNGSFHSILCSYNISEVNRLMDLKFETCVQGVGNIGFERNGNTEQCLQIPPSSITQSGINTCNFLGPGLEVTSPLFGETLTPLHEPGLVLPARDLGHITALATTTLRQTEYLFAGTDDGRLYQFTVVSPLEAVLVRELQLDLQSDSSDTRVTQLLASQDGPYVFALTARKLLRLPVNTSEMFDMTCSNFTAFIETAPAPGEEISVPSHVLTIITPIVVVFVAAMVIALVIGTVLVYRRKVKKLKSRTNTSWLQMDSNPKPELVSVSSVELKEFIKQLPKKVIIPCNQLRLLGSIGQGEFGIVYKAHLTKWHGNGDPKVVAVKTLKGFFTPNDVKSMMDEVLTMECFDHPNVMSLIGVCVDGGAGPSIIMPYMANGSLLNFLKKERENVIVDDDKDPDTINAVQKQLLNVCLQVAKGMEYLAKQKFVHRDLAARNCMINQKGVIKVSDFGLTESIYTSGYYRQDRSDTAVRLAYKWLPLESLQDSIFTTKSDVWSFGVTCWEVFSGGKGPYAGMDPCALVKMLESDLRLERPNNAACSEETFALLLKCWHIKPESRPSFRDLVADFSHLLESVAGYLELMALPVSDSQEKTDSGESDIMHGCDEKESGVLKE